MTKKKGFKRAIAWVLATGMAIGLAVTGGGRGTEVEAAAPKKFDSVSSINYSTILGGAVDYGIV